MTRIRSSVLAGSWYPGDPDELAATVDGYLAAGGGSPPPAGRVLVAVAPHAGFTYSGATAGLAHAALARRRPRRLVILAPNHRAPLDRIALSGAAGFATPLGTVPVDTDAVARLAACPAFVVDEAAHRSEHAVEIQLPLLQRWGGDPPAIVPLLVPPLDRELRETAAGALAALQDDETAFLVSTDFTHYGSAYGFVPFTDDVPARLEQLDAGAILRILAADPSGLRAYGRETGLTMCGLEAAALALEAGLPAGYEGALLGYSRSGDRDRDYALSVSYAAVVLAAPGEAS
ncbi:MAG: AmmeMemoRadiSam system protein B [bacterium]|nr:AmmeMemoRadiSam system protein B [bacterium]